MILSNYIKKAIDYIFPSRCISCKKLTDSSFGVCSDCFIDLNFISKPYCSKCGRPFEFEIKKRNLCSSCVVNKPNYELARSLFKFDEYSKKLVHDFKYNDSISNAGIFARLILARYKSDFVDIDFIVPVPMNRFKRVFRRYNPAQILALELSKQMGIKMLPDLLIKKKWTKPQVSLTKSEREKNLKGSIIYNQRYECRNSSVLLVDDVRTTGTTSKICVSVLKSNNISSVKLVTIGST